jgi:hypothetical protein
MLKIYVNESNDIWYYLVKSKISEYKADYIEQ